MLGVNTLPVGHEDEIIDAEDHRMLYTHILQQAVDDYVKLAHPILRKKKYLQEHYLTAIDFIFDDQYRLAAVENDNGHEISVPELIGSILGTERNQISLLRTHAINTARDYWNDKNVSALDHIPETVFIEGRVFNIEHALIKGYSVDVDASTIVLDKTDTAAHHKVFLEAVVYATCLVVDSNIRVSEMKRLSAALFNILKVNACFSFTGVAKLEELFTDLRQQV